jgi:CRP/FNR family transcriptional regulator
MRDEIADKVTYFFGQYERHRYKKGDYLKILDKQPYGISCLQSGVVRCFSLSKAGAELTINIFKPISFFPVSWVINDANDNYTYEAVTDVEVVIAPKDKFKAFLQNNPDVVYDLLKRIYRGLDGYFLRMESLLSGDPYFRVVVQLVIHIRRFGVQEGEKYRVNLTHTQLAALSGLTRETVTRKIKKLEEQKLIDYEGKKLTVLNLKKLEEHLLS